MALPDPAQGNLISKMGLATGGVEAGLELNDYGLNGDLVAGDGLWGFSVQLDAPLPATKVLLEIGLTPQNGDFHIVWPYLMVE